MKLKELNDNFDAPEIRADFPVIINQLPDRETGPVSQAEPVSSQDQC